MTITRLCNPFGNQAKPFCFFHLGNTLHQIFTVPKNLQKIPPERKHLRAGVEPLMKAFHAGEKRAGKLRVRGQFQTAFYGIAMAIAINFKRIHAFIFLKPAIMHSFFALKRQFYAFFSIFNCKSTIIVSFNSIYCNIT